MVIALAKRAALTILGISRLGRRLELMLDAGEAAGADEGQRALEAAAAGRRQGDDDVDVGLGGIADVLHERDLGSDEVLEALLAVEKDVQPVLAADASGSTTTSASAARRGRS